LLTLVARRSCPAPLPQHSGREGFRLALLARNEATVGGYAAALRGEGIDAEPFAADAADANSLRAAFASVRERLGDPTVLVYNAAMPAAGLPSALQAEDLVASLRVNVVGALVAAQEVILAMRAAGKGTILFTGGGLALYPAAQYAALGIGKAAIRHLAFDLAQELEPEGIRVATITVAGSVQPGSHFDPDTIAESFWQLHGQEPPAEQEIVYR